jgi:hypothetical protein
MRFTNKAQIDCNLRTESGPMHALTTSTLPAHWPTVATQSYQRSRGHPARLPLRPLYQPWFALVFRHQH